MTTLIFERLVLSLTATNTEQIMTDTLILQDENVR